MMTPKVEVSSVKVCADKQSKQALYHQDHLQKHHHQQQHSHVATLQSTQQQSANNKHLPTNRRQLQKQLHSQSLWQMWSRNTTARTESILNQLQYRGCQSSEKMMTMRSKMGRNSSSSTSFSRNSHYHLHLWSLVLFFSLTLTTLLTSTSEGTSSSSFPSSLASIPSYSSSSYSSHPSSHISSHSSFHSPSSSLLPSSKLFPSLKSTGSRPPSSSSSDLASSIRLLLLPRPPMMAMLSGHNQKQQQQNPHHHQVWSTKQKRSVTADQLTETETDRIKPSWNIPRQILHHGLRIENMLGETAANEQTGRNNNQKDWNSIINLITAATDEQSITDGDASNDANEKSNRPSLADDKWTLVDGSRPQSSNTTEKEKEYLMTMRKQMQAEVKGHGGWSLQSPLSKRRLVINSSSGARLYVDPRRGVDWPSDEEAIERGLRLPDSHPRRPPQPVKQQQSSRQRSTDGEGQPNSGYFYRRPQWMDKSSTTSTTTTTTTTSTTPNPPVFNKSYKNNASGTGNRNRSNGNFRFNKTASVISGRSGDDTGNSRLSDSYYDVDHHRVQFGHRYYGGSQNQPITSARQIFKSPALKTAWLRSGKGNSGENSNLNSNKNSRDLNNNYLAHLYRTNRTAWEIEYRKYQQFAAEAKQRGHVYGKVSRVNREAGGDGGSSASSSGDGDRLYDVPQVDCPSTENGVDRFACPTADAYGRYLCIDDQHICNGYIDCPRGEDEDTMSCMFYKSTKAHLDVLADYLLQWARGRHF